MALGYQSQFIIALHMECSITWLHGTGILELVQAPVYMFTIFAVIHCDHSQGPPSSCGLILSILSAYCDQMLCWPRFWGWLGIQVSHSSWYWGSLQSLVTWYNCRCSFFVHKKHKIMVDWVTLKLKIVELIRINTFVVIQRGIPHSGTIIYMTFFVKRLETILFAVSQTHGYFLLCL